MGRSVRGNLSASCGKLTFVFVSKIPASHWCLGVPPPPLLHSSVLLLPYVLLHCRTAAVLSFLSCNNYIQRMIPYWYVRTAALPYCPVILLFFQYLLNSEDDAAPICSCPPYRSATGILREYH